MHVQLAASAENLFHNVRDWFNLIHIYKEEGNNGEEVKSYSSGKAHPKQTQHHT